MRHKLFHSLAVALSVAAIATAPARASAQDLPSAATIVGMQSVDDRLLMLDVFSPAMGREIPVNVLLPHDRGRAHGVYYLLDGNSGQVSNTNWLDPDKGDARNFFADKDVTVVMPVGGTGTLYTDWAQEHPKFGTVRWETFLTEELPPLIDARFGTNGRNVIGGISSGAQGALMLAQRTPDLYDGVVGYSGCYLTEGPVGKAITDLVVVNGMANSEMMWGPQGTPEWAGHDLLRNASRLAGKTVYLSSGTGLPGPHETLDSPGLANTVVVGGVLEAAANACTDQLTQTLRNAGADVTRSAQPVGVHAWPYWKDELARSWPVIDAALR
ncbi:alpha/beta hydrolase [Prescottella subtropica]|uniref:alpha/beta hydrolase n=1 Tax=Prescottella subtropica TaxID=2545757 RepID=UPI0010F7409C|nr:alpha/beta hydrolase family protein [Prescottella subtropica]